MNPMNGAPRKNIRCEPVSYVESIGDYIISRARCPFCNFLNRVPHHEVHKYAVKPLPKCAHFDGAELGEMGYGTFYFTDDFTETTELREADHGTHL